MTEEQARTKRIYNQVRYQKYRKRALTYAKGYWAKQKRGRDEEMQLPVPPQKPPIIADKEKLRKAIAHVQNMPRYVTPHIPKHFFSEYNTSNKPLLPERRNLPKRRKNQDTPPKFDPLDLPLGNGNFFGQ